MSIRPTSPVANKAADFNSTEHLYQDKFAKVRVDAAGARVLLAQVPAAVEVFAKPELRFKQAPGGAWIGPRGNPVVRVAVPVARKDFEIPTAFVDVANGEIFVRPNNTHPNDRARGPFALPKDFKFPG